MTEKPPPIIVIENSKKTKRTANFVAAVAAYVEENWQDNILVLGPRPGLTYDISHLII
jgi:hypothetical protein